jgi:hypothetical protein
MVMLKSKQAKTNMAEEEKTPEITSDDIDTLRILLHTIKGISPVSSTTVYAPIEEEANE